MCLPLSHEWTTHQSSTFKKLILIKFEYLKWNVIYKRKINITPYTSNMYQFNYLYVTMNRASPIFY